MELKNIFTPEAQQVGSQIRGVVRKAVKPLEQPIQDLGEQFTAKVQPAIQGIQETVDTSFVEPVVKPIQEGIQRTKIVGEINNAFQNVGINVNDIKNLAEEEGIDYNLVLTKFQNNGIKVQGMEELQAQQKEQVQSQDISRNASARTGILENVGGFIQDVTGGAIAEIPKVAGETASFLSKAGQYNPVTMAGTAIRAGLSDKTYDELRAEQMAGSEQFATAGQKGKEFVQKYGAYDPNSIGSSIGETVTDIGSTLVGPNKVGVLKKGQTLLNAGKIGLEGALAGAKYDVATKGEITPTGVATGVGTNLTIAGLSKLAKAGIDKIPGIKQYFSGLDDKTVQAIKNTPKKEVDEILKQAESSAGKMGDYVQTPYHIGAQKAQKTLDSISESIGNNQNTRMGIINKASKDPISVQSARDTLKNTLESYNIRGVKLGKDGVKVTPVKGREAMLDFENAKDVEAFRKLNTIIKDDVSPAQTMDRIKKLQEWVYENKSGFGVKGISDRMEKLVSKVQTSMNSTFKSQLPSEYTKVLKDMSDDIKMQSDIKRVFGIDDLGQLTGNRGEMVMKRLSTGTTTGGEARELALRIKEKYGVDLIKEARLRQMAMELVGDDRAKTLFGAISQGKKGVVDYIVEKTAGKIINKKKVIQSIAKQKKVGIPKKTTNGAPILTRGIIPITDDSERNK